MAKRPFRPDKAATLYLAHKVYLDAVWYQEWLAMLIAWSVIQNLEDGEGVYNVESE